MSDKQRDDYTKLRKKRDELIERATQAALHGELAPDSKLVSDLKAVQNLIKIIEAV